MTYTYMVGLAVAVVVFVGWVLAVHFLSPSICRIGSASRIPLRKLLKDADNGDLIFLSGTRFGEKAIKLYTRSYYSHVAIILRDIDPTTSTSIPYVWEADLGSGYRNGPRVMRLSDKLHRWKGSKVGMWRRYLGRRPPTGSILDVVGRYVSYGMDTDMVSWAVSRLISGKMAQLVRPPKTVFCSELIATTLRELGIGIRDTQKPPVSYSPEDLVSDTHLSNYGIPTLFDLRES